MPSIVSHSKRKTADGDGLRHATTNIANPVGPSVKNFFLALAPPASIVPHRAPCGRARLWLRNRPPTLTRISAAHKERRRATSTMQGGSFGSARGAPLLIDMLRPVIALVIFAQKKKTLCLMDDGSTVCAENVPQFPFRQRQYPTAHRHASS